MKRIVVIVAIVAVAVLGFVLLKKDVGSQAGKPIVKIGVILPITGNLAQIGDNSRVLIEKIREDTKNSPINFKFIVEDNNTEVKRSVVIANKLVNADKVDAIFSMFTNFSTAVTPIATKAGLLHVCVANDCEVATGPLNFANWQQNDVSARKVTELMKDKGAKKVVIFTLEHSGYILIANAVKDEFAKNGIEYEEFFFNPSERDFVTMVDKAATIPDVDYWFLNTMSPAIELIRKQMLDKNITIPVTGIQSFGTAEIPDLFKGYEYIDAAEVSDEIKEYVMSCTGSKNITIPAYAYDSVNIMVKLYEDFYNREGRLPNSEEAAEELHRMNTYYGSVGAVHIAPNRIMYSDTVIKVVE
ncbi:MAG: ABC transporter substrate-binding protein [Lactobacillus sp.]|jgi:ABC-type branched-subunit amino acid transport system substrate-binding protein|nr:ABC transporter substrate-binding protein [Lactobacillus sp.]